LITIRLASGSDNGTATITVTGIGTIQPSANFSATPLSGSAPLSVSFSGSIPGTNYALNFGDGSQPILGD